MSRPTVVVAPTALKGSFSPREAAEALAVGVRRAVPEAVLLTCPVADGGDGLLDVLLAPGGVRERVEVTGPLGAPVATELGWLNADTAVCESSGACGLALLPVEDRDPLRATSRGVGELIFEASERGARTIVVGLGGTATVDGGAGAARGLGWTFADASGSPLPEGGGGLERLAEVGGGWRVAAQVLALADVTTPLVGPRGAARVFAPQKGASEADVELLVRGLDRLAAVWAHHGRGELATLPGGGAAGGLGAGLVFFAHARLEPGAAWVLERVGFDAAMSRADFVLTAEGAFDGTSLVGKATGEVVRRAQAARTRVAVVAGRVGEVAGVHAVGGDGRMLDATGLAALAERATREAFGLPRG